MKLYLSQNCVITVKNYALTNNDCVPKFATNKEV